MDVVISKLPEPPVNWQYDHQGRIQFYVTHGFQAMQPEAVIKLKPPAEKYVSGWTRPESIYDVERKLHIRTADGATSEDGITWPELSRANLYKRLKPCCNCGAPKHSITCEYCKT